jgi:hypothetical protein
MTDRMTERLDAAHERLRQQGEKIARLEVRVEMLMERLARIEGWREGLRDAAKGILTARETDEEGKGR